MAETQHNVIIGIGIAGHRAAETLRARDPDCRITIITMGRLPFYHRYDLPKVFQGCRDWRDLLVHPPSWYDDNRITLRRNSRVVNVDGRRRAITFAHNEELRYDRLLVCSGGRSHLPVDLSDYRHLLHTFASFEAAMAIRRLLPEGGRLVMLGGDMIGLDLARTLVAGGYRVTLVTNDYTFWPHRVDAAERRRYLDALARIGIELFEDAEVRHVEEGARGMPARRLVFADGTELYGDVVMPFYGTVPAVEFMLGSDVDIERGLLVNPQLHTTNEQIWAAGDVCQIWSAEENGYRFYHGWNNLYAMGEVAARNMTGEDEPFVGDEDEDLRIDPAGGIDSPFWAHHWDREAWTEPTSRS